MNTWITWLMVSPAHAPAFIEASVPYAEAVLREAGLVSFALLQQADDPGGFSVFEAFHDEAARAAHLASAHYRAWQASTAPFLATPPSARPYRPIIPAPADWERHLEAEA